MPTKQDTKYNGSSPYIAVLGVAQDAGYPQAACSKQCCRDAWNDTQKRRMVSCLALIDPEKKEYWIFDATPDFKDQIFMASQLLNSDTILLPKGIFLTHAHIGHYTGLMELGHEVIGAKMVPVYTMPRMAGYLTSHGPWSQLVAYENIKLTMLNNEEEIELSNGMSVIPMQVPHRDEFSETVGFVINGKNKRAMFIPDIDKWDLWDRDINMLIIAVDYAFLDGTFYKNGEIKHRDMSEIKHPFIEESMNRFEKLSSANKKKVHFIHFNHTNPVIWDGGHAIKEIQEKGFNVALESSHYPL